MLYLWFGVTGIGELEEKHEKKKISVKLLATIFILQSQILHLSIKRV